MHWWQLPIGIYCEIRLKLVTPHCHSRYLPLRPQMSISDDLERYSAVVQVVWGLLLLRLSENKKKAAIGGASIAAILVVLRHLLSRKRSKFISDYSQLAQEAKPAADNLSYAFDEYDVIIVGGGTEKCPIHAATGLNLTQAHLAVCWHHGCLRTPLSGFCYWRLVAGLSYVSPYCWPLANSV